MEIRATFSGPGKIHMNPNRALAQGDSSQSNLSIYLPFWRENKMLVKVLGSSPPPAPVLKSILRHSNILKVCFKIQTKVDGKGLPRGTLLETTKAIV